MGPLQLSVYKNLDLEPGPYAKYQPCGTDGAHLMAMLCMVHVAVT